MGSNMAKCVFFEDLSGRFKISWAKDRFESGILVLTKPDPNSVTEHSLRCILEVED